MKIGNSEAGLDVNPARSTSVAGPVYLEDKKNNAKTLRSELVGISAAYPAYREMRF